MTVQIRLATAGDAEAIAQIYIDSAEHHASIDPERYYLPERAAIIERYRSGSQHPRGLECITLAAELDGSVVGFVDARLERPFDAMHLPMLSCHVAELAVAAEQRCHGIGKLLMEAAEQWGRENGAQYLSLEYNAKNPRAASFYERLGYQAGSVFAIKWL